MGSAETDAPSAVPVAARGPGTAAPRRSEVGRPAAIYLAGQALTLLIVGLIAHARGRSLYPLLSSWDGRHMLAIAAHGYSQSTEAGVSTSVAFFPGYPSVVSAVHTVSRLSYVNSGLAVSIGAGLATAVGLTRLCRTVLPSDDERAPLILVALASTAPMAIVLTMTYSESLFCAVAVWALVLMTERQWIASAMAIEFAGTVRQTAIALCVALAVALVVAARRGDAPLRAWAAVIVAPIGAVSYLAWADRHTGVRGAWFDAQRNGWGASFDFGHDTWIWSYHAI
ncbi:MAG: integral rane protein, partial [Jatrophihabitantaceae bacterium]|nr:integral rane protein [Jatrophihabitantaceae bacterium]